jgi:hypothetical protein
LTLTPLRTIKKAEPYLNNGYDQTVGLQGPSETFRNKATRAVLM